MQTFCQKQLGMSKCARPAALKGLQALDKIACNLYYDHDMKTGFAKTRITPPLGAPIIGYYEARFVKGVADDLFARAVAFDDGARRAVIVALDICLLPQKYFDAMKDAIAGAAGMDRDAIFINCSHTHTGPLVGGDFATRNHSSGEYDAFLVASVRDAALQALSDLRPSRFGIARGQAKNISFVRRYRMKDGSVATNPGVGNPAIDHALGAPNETVTLVRINREGGDGVFIVNFGTHPDSVGGELVSADYPGFACALLERALPGVRCLFLQAPQGDVNHVNVHPTAGEAALAAIDFDGVPRSLALSEHMGRSIAGAVLSICSIAEPVAADTLSYASRRVDLPSHQENDRLDEVRHTFEMYESGRAAELPFKEMALTTAVAEAKRIMRLEHGPESFPYLLSALRVGDLAFAGIGGEPFTEIRNRIDAGSPFKNTVQCCLTNGAGGYIPTRAAYGEGGYETASSNLKPGCDDILVEAMLELLHEQLCG